MNENMAPVTNEAAIITSVSPSYNDIIDLTEINDSDESEVTSSCSSTVSNNAVNSQQPRKKPARNRRKSTESSEDCSSSKAWSESADDSICILYENIQPPPDIQVVNEIIIDNIGENECTNNDLRPIEIPPIMMGTFTESSDIELRQISPHFAEILSQRTCSSTQPINYSLEATKSALQQAPHHSSLPSCKYTTTYKKPSLPISLAAPYPVSHQRICLPTTEAPLNLKTLPDNQPDHGSVLEKSNVEIQVPKIQCGICLDGPDEISASNRNFTSTKCGHVFCDICIKTSLKTAAKCPKCRKRVTSKQIHPLYL